MHSGTNAEQRFQNSTCENKLTAEGKQGFARKFTRFQNFPHFARDCTSPISVSSFPICSIPVQGFQNWISPRIDPDAFLPRAQQPLNVTCHLFMIRPFATPKSNRIRVNKWCENSFIIFFLVQVGARKGQGNPT